MPLEFQSISHGKIAFGFFNIETDMILLGHYFLFARDFGWGVFPDGKTTSDLIMFGG